MSGSVVTIDTTGLNGAAGDLVFDFISGGGPANTVTISGFASDGTLGAVSPTGLVSGTLPGTVTISDDPVTFAFNEYLTGFTFGSAISFNLGVTQNAPGVGFSPDELSVFFLAGDGVTSLIATSDPTAADSLMVVDLDGSSDGAATAFSVSDPSGVNATIGPGAASVPEPGNGAVLGLVVLVWSGTQRYRRSRSRV